MRLTTNDKLIKQRSTWARYLTFGGMALLLGALITSFMTDYIVVAYVALLVGFMFAMVGSNLANKWVKPPRADQVLEKSLKGFDNKHHLYNYILPAEHVLVTPGSVLVLRTKYQNGLIVCKNGKWNRPWRWTRLFGFLAEEPLGNPIAEMQIEIERVKQLITEKVQDGSTVAVDGYVVFTDPKVDLSIDDKNLPVVRADDLKDTLRKGKRPQPMTVALLDKVDSILSEGANAKTAK